MFVKGFNHGVIYRIEELKASSMSNLKEMAKLRSFLLRSHVQAFKFYFTDMRKCYNMMLREKFSMPIVFIISSH